VYVSHRLREIFELCDAVTVLRDGTHVATRPLAGLDERALVQMMIAATSRRRRPSTSRRRRAPSA
jgi:ribose transport system ATP-binding protein